MLHLENPRSDTPCVPLDRRPQYFRDPAMDELLTSRISRAGERMEATRSDMPKSAAEVEPAVSC